MDAWRAALSGDMYSVAAHVGDHLESINQPICDGQTLIFAAIFAGSLSVLEYLLGHGADPNVFDDYMQTPLYVLVMQPGPEEFRVSGIVSLAMAGAALDKGRGGTGDTPLMACARYFLKWRHCCAGEQRSTLGTTMAARHYMTRKGMAEAVSNY